MIKLLTKLWSLFSEYSFKKICSHFHLQNSEFVLHHFSHPYIPDDTQDDFLLNLIYFP